MDLTALQDFLAVAHEGSFAAAARMRRSPKSTISKRVQDLEAALGARLIERTTRSLRLTAEGALLAERGQRLVEDAHELESLFRDQGAGPHGRLRVSTPQLFGEMFIGEIGARLAASYPRISLEATFHNGPVDLIEEGLDCAVRLGSLQPSSLITRSLARADNRLFASPAMAEMLPRIKHPADLADVPTVAYAPSQWRLTRGDETETITPKGPLTFGGVLAVKTASIAGAGVAMMPAFLARESSSERTLVPVLAEWSGPHVEISVVYPSAKHLSQRVRAFIDVLTRVVPGRLLG
jgi:DNA-binding transcriptional LysR family regulator